MPDYSVIDAAISDATGHEFRAQTRSAAGGGCINHATVVGSGRLRYFVKRNAAERLWMFEAEATGLNALGASGAVSVPTPICTGTTDGEAFLVLEYLELGPPGTATAATLGEQLAALHAEVQPAFGWVSDNAIGATPQPNPMSDDWAEFFRRHRLEFQLERSLTSGFGGSALKTKGERLGKRLKDLLAGHAPIPSLLHGDLWSGNFAAMKDGRPVIFDPAVYWGDREADIAMTELFGRFPQAFYDAYSAAWALDPGYRVRRTLYNLYHVLNHLNLFGGGYARQAERMMDELLAELG